MSRCGRNPKWLIYLPPTMSPSESTQEEGLLEDPKESCEDLRHNAVPKVVCEERRRGSRAVGAVCRDETAAAKRFGVPPGEVGAIFTRTGRRFCDDSNIERQLLDIVRDSLGRSEFWEKLDADWALIDCEVMPWA